MKSMTYAVQMGKVTHNLDSSASASKNAVVLPRVYFDER